MPFDYINLDKPWLRKHVEHQIGFPVNTLDDLQQYLTTINSDIPIMFEGDMYNLKVQMYPAQTCDKQAFIEKSLEGPTQAALTQVYKRADTFLKP